MGSLSDNGGGVSPDGGVPDLPPEWGEIVIPDDVSTLTEEIAIVQAELRRERARTPWQRLLERSGLGFLRRIGLAGLRAPAIVVSMAILVTLASLFASAWPGPARPPSTQRTPGSGNDNRVLPRLELLGADERPVPLLGQLPAVILLIDGCDCAGLVRDTAAAVRPEITVVTVLSGAAPSSAAPANAAPANAAPANAAPATQRVPQAAGGPVRELRDPTGELRVAFHLAAPDGTAVAVLVSRAGEIVRYLPRAASVEDFRPDLARI